MQTLKAETTKRTIHFITTKKRIKKTKKVGNILKDLGLDKIGTGKNTLSINHDNLLYK